MLGVAFNDLGNQFTTVRCMLEEANCLSRPFEIQRPKYNGEVGILATAEIWTDSHDSVDLT
jgi:hypothetical protein